MHSASCFRYSRKLIFWRNLREKYEGLKYLKYSLQTLKKKLCAANENICDCSGEKAF